MNIEILLKQINYTVLQGEADQVEISGVEFDSRKIKKGDLFVCTLGFSTDGHKFAKMAYDSGCRAFLCQRPVDLPEDAFIAVTDDTRKALGEVSAAFFGYPSGKLHVIGITGTKGKTTTALLVQSIFEKNGVPCGYIGSNGLLIDGVHRELSNTTPESRDINEYLAEMVSKGMTHAVLEVSSQGLALDRVTGIDFEVCVFTNLALDHIGEKEHESFEAYRDAKRSLFTDYNCDEAIYNADDPQWEYMMRGLTCKKTSVSTKDRKADYFAYGARLFRDETTLGVSFNCTHGEETCLVKMCIPGDFSVMNGLTAMAICGHYGITMEQAAEALLATFVDGRFEIVKGGTDATFIVDFAHNGLSLSNALSTLRSYNPNRIICVYGSVGGRTRGRRRELAEVASKLADYSIITSDNPDFEPPENIAQEIASYYQDEKTYEIVINRGDAINRAVMMAGPGDIVLFAGKGHEKYQLVEGKKLPFIEKNIILESCDKKKKAKAV